MLYKLSIFIDGCEYEDIIFRNMAEAEGFKAGLEKAKGFSPPTLEDITIEILEDDDEKSDA